MFKLRLFQDACDPRPRNKIAKESQLESTYMVHMEHSILTLVALKLTRDVGKIEIIFLEKRLFSQLRTYHDSELKRRIPQHPIQ